MLVYWKQFLNNQLLILNILYITLHLKKKRYDGNEMLRK